MGASVTRETDLAANKYLVQFLQAEHIPITDDFWPAFISFYIAPPLTSHEQKNLDYRLEDMCELLLSHNLQSENFGTLIDVFLDLTTKLVNSSELDNTTTRRAFNTLFIIRSFLKYLMENVPECQVLEHFESGGKLLPQRTSPRVDNSTLDLVSNSKVDKDPNNTPKVHTDSNNYQQQSKQVVSTEKFERFLEALYNIIIKIPLDNSTHFLHLESVNCLLVLLSKSYLSQQTDKSVAYKCLMTGTHLNQTSALVKVLLENFVQCKRTPNPAGDDTGGSIVLSLASNLWSMVTFSRATNEAAPITADNTSGLCDTFRDTAHLANHSLLLLLVLTNHYTAMDSPFRNSLCDCIDVKMEPKKPPSFHTNFTDLFTTLCNTISLEQSTLLLYLLLHRNTNFKAFIMNHPNIELLVIPILKTLYDAPNEIKTTRQIYIYTVIVLILSEDNSFNKFIHNTQLKGILWYTERSISEISLGGLMILVLIRTIHYNMMETRDKYLHTNCLAALANMSGEFRDLHPYVAQRLVSLFQTLTKKHARLELLIKDQNLKQGTDLPAVVTDIKDLDQDLTELEEMMRMVLEILNSCLSHQLTHCPNLLYTLLYNKQLFQQFINNNRFQDVLQNIYMVIGFFSSRLERVQDHCDHLGVNEVMVTINKGISQWTYDRMRNLPELKFRYVEDEAPQEFFTPYVLDLVRRGSILYSGSETINADVPHVTI